MSPQRAAVESECISVTRRKMQYCIFECNIQPFYDLRHRNRYFLYIEQDAISSTLVHVADT